jgi:hypothetical protein
MRYIWPQTIGENDRAQRSIIDHMDIFKALEDRGPIWPNACCVSTRWGWPHL